MTYDNRQAMTVALFNLGVRGTTGPESFPFDMADALLANLHSMGWVLDGYLHEHRAARLAQQQAEEQAVCGEPTCDQPSVDWGLCSRHLKIKADEGVFDPPPRRRGSDWKGDQ